MRIVSILFAALVLALPMPAALAQEAEVPMAADGRAATGGAMTREEIMARQRGEKVQTRERDLDDGSAAGAAAAMRGQLGPLGATSDAELWEQLRAGSVAIGIESANDASSRNGNPLKRSYTQPMPPWERSDSHAGRRGTLSHPILSHLRTRVGYSSPRGRPVASRSGRSDGQV